MSKPVPALWTKDFILVTAANFLIYSVFYVLAATVAGFAMNRYHASPSIAGLVSSIFVVGMLIARLYCGPLVYRIGQKKTLFIGLAMYLLTTLVYFIIDDLTLLLAARLINGLTMGVTSLAIATIVAGIVPAERRGEGIGYHTLSMPLALASGPWIGISLMQRGGFSMNLIVSIVLLLLCFMVAFFIRPLEMEDFGKTAKEHRGSFITKYFEPKVIPIALFMVLVGLGYSGVLSFLSPFMEHTGLIRAGGYFFAVYAACALISRPYTGRLFDNHGENSVIYPSLVCFVLGMGILSMADNALMLLISGGLIGIGYSTILSSAQAIGIKAVAPDHIPIATSTIYIFLNIGVGFGPYLLGIVVAEFDYRGMYASLAGVLTLSAILYHYLHGRHTKRAVQ